MAQNEKTRKPLSPTYGCWQTVWKNYVVQSTLQMKYLLKTKSFHHQLSPLKISAKSLAEKSRQARQNRYENSFKSMEKNKPLQWKKSAILHF